MKLNVLGKALVISTVATTLLMAGKFETNLESLLKEKTKMEVKVVEKKGLEDIKGLNIVIIESTQNAQRFPIFANEDGTSVIGFSNLYFTKNSKSEESVKSMIDKIQAYNEKSKEGDLIKLFDSIPDEGYVDFKGGGDKVTVVVTDPECPYCRRELDSIEDKLKETSLRLVIAPVHGKSAFIKGQLIYDETKKAKSNKEKIEIFRKYFDKDYKLTDEQNKIDPKIVNENAQKIFSSGLVKGVPFLFVMPSKK